MVCTPLARSISTGAIAASAKPEAALVGVLMAAGTPTRSGTRALPCMPCRRSRLTRSMVTTYLEGGGRGIRVLAGPPATLILPTPRIRLPHHSRIGCRFPPRPCETRLRGACYVLFAPAIDELASQGKGTCHRILMIPTHSARTGLT